MNCMKNKNKFYIHDLLLLERSGFWGIDPEDGEVCAKIIRNSDIASEGILWEKAPVRGLKKSEYEKAKIIPGDILITTSGECGKLAIANVIPYDSAASNFIKILRVKEKMIHSHYLYYLLRSQRIQMELLRFARGTTMKNLSLSKAFESIEVIIPDINIQKCAVEMLSRTEAVYKKRENSLELLIELLEATFLEMFGDPLINTKKWGLIEFNNICSEIYRYPTFYGFDYADHGVPVVKIGNITLDGYVDYNLEKYSFVTEQVSAKYPRTILKMHDILMAVRGDGSTVKRIGLVDHKNLIGANISPNLLRFSPNKKILSPIYLYMLMISKSGQKMLEKYVTQTAKKTITAKDIKRIKVPIPPVDKQLEYEKIFLQTQLLKKKMQKNLFEVENQFNALLQEYYD